MLTISFHEINQPAGPLPTTSAAQIPPHLIQ